MSEHVFKVSTNGTHTWSADGHATGQSQRRYVLVRVIPSLHQAFCRLSMSWIFTAYTHCCITPQISKLKAHDDPGPLWWGHDISDAIFFGNIPL